MPAPHRFEADMLPTLAAAASRLVGRVRGGDAEPAVFAEVPTAWGRPDLVIARFNRSALSSRTRTGLGPVEDLTCLGALYRLRQSSASTRQIATALGLTTGYLRRAVLPALEAHGWVTRHGTLWDLTVELEPLVDWVVAVEAKRSKWREGLQQARRYRRFANRTFLAMDAAHGEVAVSIATEMATAGVGLVTVDADARSVRCYGHPRWAKPCRPLEQWVVGERLWAMHRSGRAVGTSLPVFGRSLPVPALT